MTQCRYGLILFSRFLHVVNNHPIVQFPGHSVSPLCSSFWVVYNLHKWSPEGYSVWVLMMFMNWVELGRKRKRTLKNLPNLIHGTIPKQSVVCGYSFCVQIKSNLSLSFSCFKMQISCSSLVFSSELCIAELNSNLQADLKPGKKNWEINSSSPTLYTICMTLNCVHSPIQNT